MTAADTKETDHMSAAEYFASPVSQLAAAFPPDEGLRGACTRLRDLTRPDYGHPRYTDRAGAAKLILRRNLVPIVIGNGNRAARREAALALAAMPPSEPLSPRDVDILAEQYSEARRAFGRCLDRPIAGNFHD